MFSDCSSLRSLDLSGLDLSGVAEGGPGGTYHMFDGCSSLESLDLSGWDTSAVTNMSGMFSGCSSLESLDLSGFDVSNVSGDMANGGGMSVMFEGCSSLGSLDLSSFDTSSVLELRRTFAAARRCARSPSAPASCSRTPTGPFPRPTPHRFPGPTADGMRHRAPLTRPPTCRRARPTRTTPCVLRFQGVASLSTALPATTPTRPPL